MFRWPQHAFRMNYQTTHPQQAPIPMQLATAYEWSAPPRGCQDRCDKKTSPFMCDKTGGFTTNKLKAAKRNGGR